MLLHLMKLNPQVFYFALFIYSINLGWIAFIHLYKKGQTVVLSSYIFFSVLVSSVVVFLLFKDIEPQSKTQIYVLYSLLFIGIVGLSFFIKRKEKKGEI